MFMFLENFTFGSFKWIIIGERYYILLQNVTYQILRRRKINKIIKLCHLNSHIILSNHDINNNRIFTSKR